MKADLELHIDELVLRGLPYAQRDRISQAIQAELMRLLDESGLPPWLAGGGSLPEVRVDGLQVAAGARTNAVGAQIAGSIYSSLAGGGAASSAVGESKR